MKGGLKYGYNLDLSQVMAAVGYVMRYNQAYTNDECKYMPKTPQAVLKHILSLVASVCSNSEKPFQRAQSIGVEIFRDGGHISVLVDPTLPQDVHIEDVYLNKYSDGTLTVLLPPEFDWGKEITIQELIEEVGSA